MTNSKKNVLKVLEAMMNNKWELYLAEKESNKDAAQRNLSAMCELQTAVWLLTDRKYFQDMVDIYGVTED